MKTRQTKSSRCLHPVCSALSGAEIRKLKRTLRAAEIMSNVCFNAAQSADMKPWWRKVMGESQRDFDKSRLAWTQQMKDTLSRQNDEMTSTPPRNQTP